MIKNQASLVFPETDLQWIVFVSYNQVVALDNFD